MTGAGHNALGAWWWIVATGRERPGALTQELGDEALDLTVHRDPAGLRVALRQGRPMMGAEVEARAELARPLGLDPDRLVDRPATVVSTGAAHLLVQAADRAGVDAARPDAPALAIALARAGAQGCYLFATTSGAAAYARFFNPTVGLWEDPATGSAAGPLAWWLTAGDGGRHTIEIEQGHAMGRPSRLAVEVDGDDVTLVGSATLVAEGHLHLDGAMLRAARP